MLNILNNISDLVAGATTNLYLEVRDVNEATVLALTPTVSIRRGSDGFFFNGTIFVNTSGTPTQLSATAIGSAAPGLYFYVFVDPGLFGALSSDTYQIRWLNTDAPTGEIWDVRNVRKVLRDINTQGS